MSIFASLGKGRLAWICGFRFWGLGTWGMGFRNLGFSVLVFRIWDLGLEI